MDGGSYPRIRSDVANGNIITKTDARAITTTYGYDFLNRILQKSYSDGTSTAAYLYDVSSTNGVTISNPVGRLVRATSGSCTQTINSFDAMGRITTQWLNTPSHCGPASFIPTYGYDLAGDMTSASNAAGVTFTYTLNRSPRLTSVTSSLVDSNHPGTLFSGGHYNAAGALLSASLGSVITETRTYDSRLRLASISDGPNYSLTIPSSGGYAANSDILAANDSVNGNWTYSYDDFNRLGGSNQNIGQAAYSYGYDRFGNRWQQNGPHSMQLSFGGANNRMDGYSYDAAGNLLSDGSHSYTYDAENRITQVDGGSTATYVYDASGQRVQKTTSSGTVSYLYDLAGHQIAEFNSSGGWNRGEVYAGNRHLASYGNNTTYFIHPDWLGTERARASVSGAVCETITSLPFGDGQSTSGFCSDASPMHFAGKPRDTESNLDDFDARYYSSQLGRFTIPDWAATAVDVPYADFGNPQSLNIYTYVRNNPVNAADLDGHEGGLCYGCGPNGTTLSPLSPDFPKSPMSETEKQIDVGILEIASAIVTAGASQEAFEAGQVIKAAIQGVGASGAFVSGTMRIVGTATGASSEKIESTSTTVTALTTPAGMATTLATGNVKAGAVASDLTAAATSAKNPSEAVKDPAGTALTAGNLAKDIKSTYNTLRNWFVTPPPPPPPPPPGPQILGGNPPPAAPTVVGADHKPHHTGGSS